MLNQLSSSKPLLLPFIFAIASLMAGCGESDAERLAKLQREALEQKQREAIKRVLEVDKAYAKVRDQAMNVGTTFDKVAAASVSYAEALGATDMSDLPQDVRDAYGEHARAWRELAAFMNHYSGLTGAWRRGWDGDGAKYKYEALTKALKDSWQSVKAKAAARGVDVSAYN